MDVADFLLRRRVPNRTIGTLCHIHRENSHCAIVLVAVSRCSLEFFCQGSPLGSLLNSLCVRYEALEGGVEGNKKKER